MKKISWIIMVLLFLVAPLVSNGQGIPSTNPSCTSGGDNANWCAVFKRMDGNSYENYYQTRPACESFCRGGACTQDPKCKYIGDEDSLGAVSDTGLMCKNEAKIKCGVCHEGTCTRYRCEAEISQPAGGCRWLDTLDYDFGLGEDEGLCFPDLTNMCSNYCFVEVDGDNEIDCFDNRQACVNELLSENPEPGDLVFPACGYTAQNISKPIEGGGAGLRPGTPASEWNRGVANAITDYGSGIATAFTLDGFKPFQDFSMSDTGESLYGDTRLGPFINTFLQFAIGIAGAATVVMIVVGGFTYVMQASGQGKSRGRDMIKNAILGLILLLSSVAILNTVNPQLLNLDKLDKVAIELSIDEYERDWLNNGGYIGAGGGSEPMYCFTKEGGESECFEGVRACQTAEAAAPTSGFVVTESCKAANSQQLARSILNSGKVTYQNPPGGQSAKTQIEKLAAGNSSCPANPLVLQLINGLAQKGYGLNISSLNRRCYSGGCENNGAGFSSNHCRDGGGHAVDFGAITTPDGIQLGGPGNNAASGNFYRAVSQLLPPGVEYGQVLECNVPFTINTAQGDKGTSKEPCNHFHIGIRQK